MAPLGSMVVVGRRGCGSTRGGVADARSFTATGLATPALAAVPYRLEVFLLVCVLITTIGRGTQRGRARVLSRPASPRAGGVTSQLSNWQLVPVAGDHCAGLDT